MRTSFFKVSALALALTGCVDLDDNGKLDFDDTKGVGAGKDDAWGPSDAPSLFNANLEYRVATLPRTGEATNIPWAASYWPVYEDSINHKWDGANSSSASKKYETAFGATGVEDAVSRYHGIDAQASRKACTETSQCDAKIGESCAKRAGQTSGRCIPTWWGICHAWGPASILMAEPKYPVTRNGVTFKVNDIKALVELVHNSSNTKFVSLRCEEDADSATGIHYDNYGRPASNPECKDTNPGTYHVLITNYLGVMKQSFVEDRTFDDEVWNQPLRGYRITKQDEVTAAQANALIGVTLTGGTTVTKAGTVVKDAWSHQGSLPVTAGAAVKVAMTGTNDSDLYVNFGAQPTDTTYACRPYGGDTTETCEVTAPAGATAVFVSVKGYAATSTFSLAITTGGTTPVNYEFNANAKQFFHTKMDVDYIGESASSVDGNLAATINQYTHTDHYEYILEVDAEGKIVGGEWLGASKKAHPDFVWLPLSHRGDSVAGGKITFASVKSLLDESLVAPGTGPVVGVDKVVNESGTVTKGEWKQFGPYQLAPGKTLTATMTGASGDADLYVRKGSAPSLTAYDCRPYKSGSAEACSIVGPATVYVGVNGYQAANPFALEIRYTEGSGTVTPPPVVPFTHLNQSGTVALGEMKVLQLPIPAGKAIKVITTSSVDIDLYLQMDQAPTEAAYLARGYTSSGNETVSYTATSTGTLFIAVHGYQAGSYTIKTVNAL